MRTAPGGSATEAIPVRCVSSRDLIKAGLATLLESHPASRRFTTPGPTTGPPKVVFYDMSGRLEGPVQDPWAAETSSVVIALIDEHRPDLGKLAIERGAAAVIEVGAPATEFVAVVDAALRGRLPHRREPGAGCASAVAARRVGLTRREVDVARADRSGQDQPGDRPRSEPQHQLGEELHPQRLPEDGRDEPFPGHQVGGLARLLPRFRPGPWRGYNSSVCTPPDPESVPARRWDS